MALSKLFGFLLLVCLTSCSDSIFDGEPGDTLDVEPGDALDGKTVVLVGKALNNPLVKFIGAAIKNLETNVKAKLFKTVCRMPSCLNWSGWTKCTPITGHFGIHNRTRICRKIQTEEDCFSPSKAQNTTEYETRLCELGTTSDIEQEKRNVTCPSDYKKTEHGFCVKYVKQSKSWAEAQSKCEEDGGNLINIDSEQKSKDLAKMFADEGQGKIALIDGIRNSSDSNWEFRSGLKNATFSNWRINEPDVSQFPACRYAEKDGVTNEWKWRDHHPCTSVSSYMCEFEY